MDKLPDNVVLSVRDLVVRFESKGNGPVTVLEGISFDVYRSETLVIMGGSGSGKSTILNCLIGEIEPEAGRIIYNLPELGTVDLTHADEETRDALRKRFGILFQSGALFSSMTVAENVALPLREHSHVPESVIDIVVAIKLQQVHMLPHRDKLPSQLSGGQRKRAALARATALDPELLFYDEPSSGLDPITANSIDELILDLTHKLKVTSVVVTHDMASAMRIADRAIMIKDGRILRMGPRAEFEALRDASPDSLQSPEDRILHQFLIGSSEALREEGELGEFEKLIVGK
ncbi:MAG: ATP-binding cassette domain-containing protein [Phycisphaerae bacterium]|nr:ATP-binding cassette domain-containing protein [Phycisphaerae bacterium]